MTEDKPRMTTYIEGMKKFGEKMKDQDPKVFMDIGCGDELPLTRLVIQHAGAKKVHSIEVNPGTHKEAQKSIKRFKIEDKV